MVAGLAVSSTMPLTKAQLKEKLEDGRRRAKELEGDTSGRADAEKRTRSERLVTTERELSEAVAELSLAQDRIVELEVAADAIGEEPRGDRRNTADLIKRFLHGGSYGGSGGASG